MCRVVSLLTAHPADNKRQCGGANGRKSALTSALACARLRRDHDRSIVRFLIEFFSVSLFPFWSCSRFSVVCFLSFSLFPCVLWCSLVFLLDFFSRTRTHSFSFHSSVLNSTTACEEHAQRGGPVLSMCCGLQSLFVRTVSSALSLLCNLCSHASCSRCS